MISYSPLAVMTLVGVHHCRICQQNVFIKHRVERPVNTNSYSVSHMVTDILVQLSPCSLFHSVSSYFSPSSKHRHLTKASNPKRVVGQIALLPLEFRCAFGAASVLNVESRRRRGSNICSAVTNDHNLHPQELLSHSTDRPERQQLKEALEAMQVSATRTAVGQRLLPCAVSVIR